MPDDGCLQGRGDQCFVHPCRKVAGGTLGKGARERRLARDGGTPWPPAQPSQHRIRIDPVDQIARGRQVPDRPGNERAGHPVRAGTAHKTGLTAEMVFGRRKLQHRKQLAVPIRQTAHGVGQFGKQLALKSAPEVGCTPEQGHRGDCPSSLRCVFPNPTDHWAVPCPLSFRKSLPFRALKSREPTVLQVAPITTGADDGAPERRAGWRQEDAAWGTYTPVTTVPCRTGAHMCEPGKLADVPDDSGLLRHGSPVPVTARLSGSRDAGQEPRSLAPPSDACRSWSSRTLTCPSSRMPRTCSASGPETSPMLCSASP